MPIDPKLVAFPSLANGLCYLPNTDLNKLKFTDNNSPESRDKLQESFLLRQNTQAGPASTTYPPSSYPQGTTTSDPDPAQLTMRIKPKFSI